MATVSNAAVEIPSDYRDGNTSAIAEVLGACSDQMKIDGKWKGLEIDALAVPGYAEALENKIFINSKGLETYEEGIQSPWFDVLQKHFPGKGHMAPSQSEDSSDRSAVTDIGDADNSILGGNGKSHDDDDGEADSAIPSSEDLASDKVISEPEDSTETDSIASLSSPRADNNTETGGHYNNHELSARDVAPRSSTAAPDKGNNWAQGKSVQEPKPSRQRNAEPGFTFGKETMPSAVFPQVDPFPRNQSGQLSSGLVLQPFNPNNKSTGAPVSFDQTPNNNGQFGSLFIFPDTNPTIDPIRVVDDTLQDAGIDTRADEASITVSSQRSDKKDTECSVPFQKSASPRHTPINAPKMSKKPESLPGLAPLNQPSGASTDESTPKANDPATGPATAAESDGEDHEMKERDLDDETDSLFGTGDEDEGEDAPNDGEEGEEGSDKDAEGETDDEYEGNNKGTDEDAVGESDDDYEKKAGQEPTNDEKDDDDAMEGIISDVYDKEEGTSDPPAAETQDSSGESSSDRPNPEIATRASPATISKRAVVPMRKSRHAGGAASGPLPPIFDPTLTNSATTKETASTAPLPPSTGVTQPQAFQEKQESEAAPQDQDPDDEALAQATKKLGLGADKGKGRMQDTQPGLETEEATNEAAKAHKEANDKSGQQSKGGNTAPSITSGPVLVDAKLAAALTHINIYALSDGILSLRATTQLSTDRAILTQIVGQISLLLQQLHNFSKSDAAKHALKLVDLLYYRQKIGDINRDSGYVPEASAMLVYTVFCNGVLSNGLFANVSRWTDVARVDRLSKNVKRAPDAHELIERERLSQAAEVYFNSLRDGKQNKDTPEFIGYVRQTGQYSMMFQDLRFLIGDDDMPAQNSLAKFMMSVCRDVSVTARRAAVRMGYADR